MHSMIGGFEFESPTTRKVIAAIPDDKSSYQPDPKAKNAKQLAWHIVASEEWFLKSVIAGGFNMEGDGEEKLPAGVSTIDDILAYYDKNVPPLVEQVRKLSGEKLAAPVDFFGVFKQPNVTYLGFLLNHSVHHRGQLSTYLRPMGSKVPSIYGGSADEPFQASAQA